jgi:hypothetical protein
MTSESLTCPYCNAAIGVPTGLSAGQRIVCPRCGDTFAFRPLDAFTGGQPASDRPVATAITQKPTAAESPPAPWTLRSNAVVAGLVIAVMLIMAGIGLTFMLMTQQERRAHDTSRPPRRPGKQLGVPEPDAPVVASLSPDKLPALGYLPSGVNCLLAARIPELLATPVGIQVLRDPLKFGDGSYRLQSLPGWLGLRLEDIDHFVFAARIDEAVIPPFYLVFRTAQPFEMESMRQRLKAVGVPSASKKKLFSFRTPKSDLPFHAWLADEQTIVLALLKEQLESLPGQPATDLERLPEEVRSVLKQRREPVAPAWLVGHSREWSKTTVGKLLGQMRKEDREKLAPLQTFALWLVPAKELDVKGVFACKDAAAARELDAYFHKLHGVDATDFKTALDGPWLTLQWHTSADFLSRLTAN